MRGPPRVPLDRICPPSPAAGRDGRASEPHAARGPVHFLNIASMGFQVDRGYWEGVQRHKDHHSLIIYQTAKSVKRNLRRAANSRALSYGTFAASSAEATAAAPPSGMFA